MPIPDSVPHPTSDLVLGFTVDVAEIPVSRGQMGSRQCGPTRNAHCACRVPCQSTRQRLDLDEASGPSVHRAQASLVAGPFERHGRRAGVRGGRTSRVRVKLAQLLTAKDDAKTASIVGLKRDSGE